MRNTLVLLTAGLAAISCADETSTTGEAKTGAASKPGATTASQSSVTATPPPAKTEPAAVVCDTFIADALFAEHCAEKATIDRTKTASDSAMYCGRVARSDSGKPVSIDIETIGKASWQRTRDGVPAQPESSMKGSQHFAHVRKFPYRVTLRSSPIGGSPLCNGEQLEKLASAIIATMPEVEEPADKANRACDALLTEADIQAACKAPAKVRASMMEDGKSNYCNRSGKGVIFMVTQHPNEKVAAAGARVASEDSQAAVASKGNFVVEIKMSKFDSVCDKAGIDKLLSRVVERLP
jgi:hypothetical protein